MPLERNHYAKAVNELSIRREAAYQELERHVAEIERDAPEIAALQRELASTSIKLTKTILSHPKDYKEAIEELRARNLEAQEMIQSLLSARGYPRDYLSIHFTCPTCEDTGFVGGVRCNCLRDLLKKLSIEELNRISPLQLCDFSSFDLFYFPDQVDPNLGIIPRDNMKKIVSFCEKYTQTFSSDSASILMLGPTGLGKTHLSLAVAKEVVLKGYQVLYCTAQDILRAIELEHFSHDIKEDETLKTVLESDLLILDDLGAEYQTSFNAATVYNIVNTRLNFGRPTIISSNLTSRELEERYSQRVVSRLLTQYVYLRFVGQDVRQLKRKGNKNS